MEVYRNLFKEKTESELVELYKQFLESEESGKISDNELGKIRDEYCGRQTNGVLMMIMDLTRTVADLWYAIHKPDEEDIPMSQDDFIAALLDSYEDARERGFDSIVLAIDTDIDYTCYIYDGTDGFHCDIWDYCFDDLETLASQLYNELLGNVTEVRIE